MKSAKRNSDFCTIHTKDISHKKPTYIIFGKPPGMCPYCDRVKEWLVSGRINGEYLTVENDARHDVLAILYQHGAIPASHFRDQRNVPNQSGTMPVVFRDNQYLGGATELGRSIGEM